MSIRELIKVGAEVSFYDPNIKSFTDKNLCMTGLKELTPDEIENSDIVVIATAHSNVDYGLVQRHAKAVFDTKNVMKNIQPRENIEVL